MRPYYRYDDQPSGGFRMSFGFGWTTTIKVLIAANAVAYLIELILIRHFDVIGWLGMYGPYFIKGAFWQPVTSMFLHDPQGLWHLILNMLGLYLFGGNVERQLGRRSFLLLYFLSGAVGGMLSLVNWESAAVGASGGVFGVVIAFAMLFPHARILLFFLIPVRARYAAVFFVFVAVAGVLMASPDGVSHWGHLGGIAVGYLFIKGQPLAGKLLTFWHARRRVMDVTRSAAEQAELDRILEKVHRDGISALTNQERDFLNLMSRKYRDRG